MAGIEVDFDNMSLAAQVLDRQAGHARAIGEHLGSYARLDKGDMGFVLQMLAPVSDALLEIGTQATKMSHLMFEAGATKMERSRELYLEAEEAAHEAVRRAAGVMGGAPGPYQKPGTPGLGDPLRGPGSRYGKPDGNVFNQAFWDGYAAAEWVDENITELGEHKGKVLSRSRGVEESVDVRAFLPRPIANEPELENIRWKAGAVIGGVDWVWEQIFGTSLLEEITKPITGNWVRMEEASLAWTHMGDATRGLGQNATGILPGMAAWTGRGSEVFLIAGAAVGKAHVAAAGPIGVIALALKGLKVLAKQLAGLIMRALKWIGDKLLQLAAQMSVPVLGWVVAAANAGISLNELVSEVRWVYKWVNRLYDVISGLATKLDDMVESVYVMVDLAEALARGAYARAR